MKKIALLFLISITAFLYFKDEEVVQTEPSVNTEESMPQVVIKNTPARNKQVVETNRQEYSEIGPVVFNKDLAFESTDYYDAFLNAYKAKDEDVVIKLGTNLLLIPDKYSAYFWYGNLCHAVHILLGKTYLSSNNIEKAEYHLLKSVDNKCIEKSIDQMYSPQLSSFGPDRSLAFSLYEKGRKDSVINFFNLTKEFWHQGLKDGTIDRAIENLLTIDLSYEQEDDPNFPFEPVAYVIDYEKAPMATSRDK